MKKAFWVLLAINVIVVVGLASASFFGGVTFEMQSYSAGEIHFTVYRYPHYFSLGRDKYSGWKYYENHGPTPDPERITKAELLDRIRSAEYFYADVSGRGDSVDVYFYPNPATKH